MRSILFGVYSFGKFWENMGKRPFFQAAMAGLGKYSMGGYGRIGVYRADMGGCIMIRAIPVLCGYLFSLSICTYLLHQKGLWMDL